MFTALLMLPAHADDWVVSQAGGSLIEMPAFFDDGAVALARDDDQEVGVTYQPDHTISLHQYRVKSRLRPYAFLAKVVGLAEIQYAVDEVGRAVVSGNRSRRENFYAACRREPGELVCIELFYHADLQSDYAPMIDRIAQSFDYGVGR